MDFDFTNEQKLFRETVRTLMQRHAPLEYVREHDAQRAFPYDLYDTWVEAGLLRIPFSEEYGGIGASAIEMAIAAEEIGRVSPDYGMVFASGMFCGLNILRNGSEEQKRYWLPKLMDGHIKFVIGMSEPDAGSDVGALRTNARRDGGSWIINGQKVWMTGGGLKNAVISLYARTDPAAHYRKGMSLFLVENDAAGVQFRKLDMLGRRCSGTYEVFLNNVEVSSDRLVGGENNGWNCMLSGLQLERAISAANCCGAADAILELALQYSKDRKQFGQPIGNFQAIAHRIADMQTEIEAARSLMWRAVWLVASKKDALREITMAKLFASEVYAKVATMGVQIMGAIGLNAECDMQRYFRDSRSATIQAGTSETHRNLIAGLMGLKCR